MKHTPVLLDAVMESLRVSKGGKYIDATFGEGGYSRAILDQGGEVLAVDLDKDQIERGRLMFANERRIKFHWGNFNQLREIAMEEGFMPAEGVVFDLGLSYGQIKDSGRGFSYKAADEPLDMRLDLETKLTARDIVNSFNETDLYEIFSRYGEELDSRSIARRLVRARRLKTIVTGGDLIKAIRGEQKGVSHQTLARIFQALRIAVNRDLDNLRQGLEEAIAIISKEGRIAVVSFQSLEDRIVKRFIKNNHWQEYPVRKKKNYQRKKFARSATLRVFGKKI